MLTCGKLALSRRLLITGALLRPIRSSFASSAANTASTVNLLDWNGLDLTGFHDNAALIAQAASEIPNAGGTLRLPAGRIAVGSTIFFHAGTHVCGDGSRTEVVPIPINDGFRILRNLPESAQHPEYAVFANRGCLSSFGNDQNLAFSNFTIGPLKGGVSFTAPKVAIDNWPGHLVRMHGCDQVEISRVVFRNANDCVAFTDCSATRILQCHAINAANAAFDHWFGGGDHLVRDSTVWNCGCGVLITGAGTHGEDRDQLHSIIDNVHIVGSGQAAIIANCLTARSRILGWQVSNCIVEGGGVRANPQIGVYCGGIIGHGDVRDAVITDNLIRAVDGPPIQLQAEVYGERQTIGRAPSNCAIRANKLLDCNPTDLHGRPSALITTRGTGHKISKNESHGGTYGYAFDSDGSAEVSDDNVILPGTFGSYH